MYREKDGFRDPKRYLVALTNHREQRVIERMQIKDTRSAEKIVTEAYSYGKSKRQIKKALKC